MVRLVSRATVPAALGLVGCPDVDDSSQTSATEASTSSTNTTDPGDTSPGDDSEADTNPSMTSEATSSTGSTSEGTTTEGETLCGNEALDPREECDDGEQNHEDGPCTLALSRLCALVQPRAST